MTEGDISPTRPKSPSRFGDGETFGDVIKDTVWELANEFAGISTIFATTNESNI